MVLGPARRRLASVALLLAAVLGTAGAASGHALLISSDPAAGTSVAAAPAAISLTFGEAPDPKLSRVKVLDTAGQDHASGAPEAVPGKPASLSVPVRPLADGVYTVSWRTISAVDGHVAAGSFAFGVGAGTVVANAPPTETGGTSAGSPLAVLARLLLYAGLAGLLGAGLMGSLLDPRPPRRLRTLVLAAGAVAVVGTFSVITIQWADSGVDLGAFMASALGIVVVARLLVALAIGALLAVGWWGFGAATGRGLFVALLGIGAIGLLVDVVGGHAAAAPEPLVGMGVQWLHGVAAGLWMGGLASLVVVAWGLPTEEKTATVRRYSTWAGVFIVVVAATGLLRAIQQIGTVDAPLGSDFGRLALAKSAFLLVMGAIGAVNRFVNVPAAPRSLAGLRRWGSAELSVGALVFALTAGLVNAAPPVSSGSPAGPAVSPLVAVGKDFGTTVRLGLTVTPGTPGFNTFSVTVEDYDTGVALPASALALRFSLASQTGVGESRLDLTAGSTGAFDGSGGNLSIDGIWRVTAVVTAPSGAVEVPLVLATRVAAQPVTSDPSISPVIYTVRLPSGGSVQAYLDPGRVGTNDLHVTFFDPAGTELPVPTVTVAVAPAGSTGQLLQPRQLEPGHFVATVDLASAGSLSVDAIGPAPDGAQVHAYLVMEVAP